MHVKLKIFLALVRVGSNKSRTNYPTYPNWGDIHCSCFHLVRNILPSRGQWEGVRARGMSDALRWSTLLELNLDIFLALALMRIKCVVTFIMI